MTKKEKAKKAANHIHEAWSYLVDAEKELANIEDNERADKVGKLADNVSDIEDEINDILDPKIDG